MEREFVGAAGSCCGGGSAMQREPNGTKPVSLNQARTFFDIPGVPIDGNGSVAAITQFLVQSRLNKIVIYPEQWIVPLRAGWLAFHGVCCHSTTQHAGSTSIVQDDGPV